MVQTVQKIVKFVHAFLDKVVFVQKVQKTVKFPHAFLDLFNTRRCATTGAGCRDSAENCGVSAVGAGSWTRLLTCPCWPRHGVVEVPQLQFINWCVSSSWL